MRSQPMMRVVWIAAHLVVASAFHCPHPGLPVNGSGLRFDGRRAWQPLGHGRFDPGELVTYFCRPGRRIPAHQSTVLQCGSDGSWNGTVPRCDRMLVLDDSTDCQPQSEPVNELTVRRPVPFQISEVRIKLCQNNASDRINVSLPHSDLYVDCPPTATTSSLDAIFNCEALASPVTQLKIRIELDLAHLIRSIVVLIQSEFLCGYPPEVQDGDWHWADAETVRYECRTGAQLDGDAFSRCRTDSRQWWPLPLCVRSALAATTQSEAQVPSTQPAFNWFMIGLCIQSALLFLAIAAILWLTVSRFKETCCVRHANEQTAEMIQLDELFISTRDRPFFNVVEMVNPSLRQQGDTEPEADVEFGEGDSEGQSFQLGEAEMNGRVLLLTVLIHQWIWVNGQCPFPGLPPHGHGRAVDAAGEDLLWGRWRWFEPGQTVRYRCQPDRLVRPDSNATITCRDDGSWSDPVPLCVLRQEGAELLDDVDHCGWPAVPVGGSGRLDPTGSKKTVVYQCGRGLKLVGNGVATCDPKTGRWSSEPPVCLPIEIGWVIPTALVLGFLLVANTIVVTSKIRRQFCFRGLIS